MEKDQPDSMATVQMTKADYAASDVYSTTSEPPPVSDSHRSNTFLFRSMKYSINSKRINIFRWLRVNIFVCSTRRAYLYMWMYRRV